LRELGNFEPMVIAHLSYKVSVQHGSWCKIVNIAIEQCFVEFSGKEGDDCIDVLHGFVDNFHRRR
jgi:hypothetical protein